MERRGKERLIGASILVILVVLVVPELLSGRKTPPTAPPALALPHPVSSAPEPVRNVTVDLATSKPLDADADAASVAASAPTPTPPASAPPAAVQDLPPAAAKPVEPHAANSQPSAKYPVPASRPVVESSPPLPTSQGWSVQLGSFGSRGNAESLVQKVKSEGFPAFLSASGSGRSERFRVRVGPVSDRSAAERSVAKLKSAGHRDVTVVAPGK